MKMSKKTIKYIGLFGMSILTAACSIFFEAVADEDIATDAAEKAAEATIKKYREQEPKLNRQQRRHQK